MYYNNYHFSRGYRPSYNLNFARGYYPRVVAYNFADLSYDQKKKNLMRSGVSIDTKDRWRRGTSHDPRIVQSGHIARQGRNRGIAHTLKEVDPHIFDQVIKNPQSFMSKNDYDHAVNRMRRIAKNPKASPQETHDELARVRLGLTWNVLDAAVKQAASSRNSGN